MEIRTLTIDEVMAIHGRVLTDARVAGKPLATMTGTGVNTSIKDRGLLESAVGRQLAGSTSRLFYPTAPENAAALMYGIAMNHAFHDGNKRTALVAMLNHLDRNRLTLLEHIKWNEVEGMVLNLVRRELPDRPKLRHVVAHCTDRAERDMRALAEWIRQNSREVVRGEKQLTFDELDRTIQRFGYEFANPDGNSISIMRRNERSKRRLFGGTKVVVELQHVGAVGYPGGRRTAAVSVIKQVRRICRLTEEHGVDSAVFYGEEDALDHIINRYRQVLRSLADK